MPMHKIDGIRVGCLIVLTGFTLAFDGCGLHRAVLLELERQERLASQKQHEKALAEITEKEQAALAAQKPLKAGEIIPQMYGQALLQGMWAGSACQERVAIEIELATAKHEAPFSRYVEPADVVGTFRAVDHSAPSQSTIIETALKGSFNYQEGVLSMESTPRPLIPTKEELEEEYRLRDNAAVDMRLASHELTYGSRGPWGVENAEQAERNRNTLEELERREASRRKAKAEEYAAKVAAVKAELVPFQLSVARDSEGKGWVGTIDGPNFTRCEIHLVSRQGITTEKLSPITSQVVVQKSRNQN
ncbi:MAG: hypothetical protein U0236_03230 [Nitrospira sp.]